MTGGFVGRLRSTCAPCKVSSSGYLPPLKVTGLEEASFGMEPVVRRMRRHTGKLDKLQAPELQFPAPARELKEPSFASRSKSLPTLLTSRPVQTRSPSPDICKQRSLPPLNPTQVQTRSPSPEMCKQSSLPPLHPAQAASGSRESPSPRSLLRSSSSTGIGLLAVSKSAPPTARRSESSTKKPRFSDSSHSGGRVAFLKQRRSLSSSSLTSDLTACSSALAERVLASPKAALNNSLRRLRLEPLAVGAASAKLSFSASAASVEERVHMVDELTAVPEEVFFAMVQLGKEARQRGRHVHAPRSFMQGAPRLVQPEHLYC